MSSPITRRLVHVKTEQVVPAQLFFNRLKHRRQIVTAVRRKRTLDISHQKILASGLLAKFAKPLRGGSDRQPPVARYEKGQMNDVKRYSLFERRCDHFCCVAGAGVVQT